MLFGPQGGVAGAGPAKRCRCNTPAICAKSYVHETVVNAFEDGVLEQFAERLRSSRSNSRSEKVLAQIAAQVKADAAA